MPTKKATSAASAASHPRTQTGGRTAAQGQQPRESRGPSESIVPETAQPLHGLVGLNRRSDAPVDGDSGGIYAFQPLIFDWYENRVEFTFQKLHFCDNKARSIIGETIGFLSDSETFSLLQSKWSDARQEARQHPERSPGNENDVDMAMFARVYLAGTLHGRRPLDAIYSDPLGGMDGREDD